MSRVHHPIRPPIPEFFQAPDDGGHVPSSIGFEESGWVLDDHPLRSDGVHESEVLAHESSEVVELAGASASEPLTIGGGDAGVLAGESTDDDVWVPDISCRCAGNVVSY